MSRYRFITYFVAIFAICSLTLGSVYAEEAESTDRNETLGINNEYTVNLISADNGVELLNVQNYVVDESEKELMHGAESVLRRDNSSGEAWIVFEVKYLSEFYAVSYHLASDVAHFSFEFSKDAQNWESADVTAAETTAPDKWTKVEYTAENIEGVRYVKVVWGEEDNTANWWNPYFGGIWANAGESAPQRIEISTAEELVIPIYDSVVYELEAKVLDQIDLECDANIVWSCIECEGDEVIVSPDGKVEISSDMTEGTRFTVQAETEDKTLSEQKEITLKSALVGDLDGDNIITVSDIDVLCDNYGKKVNADNRLCDVDKNGFIDILDLAYVARSVMPDEITEEER